MGVCVSAVESLSRTPVSDAVSRQLARRCGGGVKCACVIVWLVLTLVCYHGRRKNNLPLLCYPGWIIRCTPVRVDWTCIKFRGGPPWPSEIVFFLFLPCLGLVQAASTQRLWVGFMNVRRTLRLYRRWQPQKSSNPVPTSRTIGLEGP